MVDTMKESVRNMNGFLQSAHNVIIIGPLEEIFKKTIGYSEYCLSNNITEVPDSFKTDIMHSLDILQEFYVCQPISKQLTSFIHNYIVLIHNVNNNIIKNKNIEDKCGFIDRIFNDFLTSVEVFLFLKELIRKHQNISNYALPSVEISRHYLESFNKKEKVQEKTTCTPKNSFY
jgi:hypothetical protein